MPQNNSEPACLQKSLVRRVKCMRAVKLCGRRCTSFQIVVLSFQRRILRKGRATGYWSSCTLTIVGEAVNVAFVIPIDSRHSRNSRAAAWSFEGPERCAKDGELVVWSKLFDDGTRFHVGRSTSPLRPIGLINGRLSSTAPSLLEDSPRGRYRRQSFRGRFGRL